MRFAIIHLFFILSNISYSQGITRKILDINTQAPVPFATVKILHSPKGEITSETGEFRLTIEVSDTVLISSVGYEKKILVGRDVPVNIYLVAQPVQLQNVTLSETVFIRTVILGNGKDFLDKSLSCHFTSEGSSDGCHPWAPSNMKEEFAERIILPDSVKVYRLVKVFIPTKKRNHYGPLLLRVYAEDTGTTRPGEELVTQLIPVTRKNIQKNKVVIELSKENIYIRDSKVFYISLGWPPGQNFYAGFTALSFYDQNKENTYARSLASDTYSWYPFLRLKDGNGKETQINSVYAVIMEERNRR
jgi:hypothetical protein